MSVKIINVFTKTQHIQNHTINNNILYGGIEIILENRMNVNSSPFWTKIVLLIFSILKYLRYNV